MRAGAAVVLADINADVLDTATADPDQIAVSFLALAAYISVAAAWPLFGANEAEHTAIGLVLAGLSLLIIPGLF